MESFQGLSERKKRFLLHEEAVRTHERLLDVFRCVERLADIDPASFRRLVQRDNLVAAVPRADAAPAFKADVRQLVRRLPLHIMACVLAQEPSSDGDWVRSKLSIQELCTVSWHGHVARALRLLSLLCDVAASLPVLASAIVEQEFQHNVIDAVVLVLLSIAGADHRKNMEAACGNLPKAEAAERVQLLPAALRALSAALLADGKGSKHSGGVTHALCTRLLAHPRAEVFLDVVFDAVRTLYRMVRAALEAEVDSVPDISVLAWETGLSMEWVTDLCSAPLFYHSMVLHDDSMAAPLRLIWAGLDLHRPPFAPPPYSVEGSASPEAPQTDAFTTSRGDGSIELLAARSLALLRTLTEFEQRPFLDQASDSASTRELARHTATRATHFAGLVMRRPPSGEWAVQSAGEGQVAVNALQVLEVLADDSNFRGMAMQLAAAPAAAALTLPPAAFASAWCAGDESRDLHIKDFALKGVPILVGPQSADTLRRLKILGKLQQPDQAAKPEAAPAPSKGPSKCGAAARAKHIETEALQRSVTVFEILGNLHCHNEQCSPEMERLFLSLLGKEIQKRDSAGGLELAVQNLKQLERHVQGLQMRAQAMELSLVTAQDQLLLSQLIVALESLQKK